MINCIITWGFPSQFIRSTNLKVLMATPQERRLGYHTPKQVSNQEPQDTRPCVLTATLLGGVSMTSYPTNNLFCMAYAKYNLGVNKLVIAHPCHICCISFHVCHILGITYSYPDRLPKRLADTASSTCQRCWRPWKACT